METYGGFWIRLRAYLADVIVMLPLIPLQYWVSSQSRRAYFYLFPVELLFGLWFSVYLVKRYGGTPGKLLVGLRIRNVDGSPVGWRAAILRHSVDYGLSVVATAGLAIAVYRTTDGDYLSLSLFNRMAALSGQQPRWTRWAENLMVAWTWSEFIVLLFNEKRRALHDYLAGTVVVRMK